jgi:c(7)-type cytochrome triheme protein
MKKLFVLSVIVCVMLTMSLTALAVPPGKTVVLEPKGAGKVVIEGKIHADKGIKCPSCHPAIFKMKKGADVVTMKDMNEGKFCGACHDGAKAFGVKEKDNCPKCHAK